MVKRMSGCSLFGVAMLAFVLSVGGQIALATPTELDDYCVFGCKGVTLKGVGTVTGLVGSNADMLVQSNLSAMGVYDGGSLTTSGSISGRSVVFDGDVSVSGNVVIGGTIDAGGNVTLKSGVDVGSPVITGNVTANGNVLMQSSVDVYGNVLANGNVTASSIVKITGSIGVNGAVKLSSIVTVGGGVRYGTTYTGDATVTIGSPPPVNGLSVVNPVDYTPVVCPAPTTFSSGGTNINLAPNASLDLAPGSYAALTSSGNNTLRLVCNSGVSEYYFDSFTGASNFVLDLVGDVAGGDVVKLFVTGNVSIGSIFNVRINGVDMESVDKNLASKVYAETHGTWTAAGVAEWFGTVFAPNGDITFKSDVKVVGQLHSCERVIMESVFNVSCVPFDDGEPNIEDIGIISGYKWLDENKDGVFDGGESGLKGWTIFLKNPDTGAETSMNTDGNGYYEFGQLPFGSYLVSESLQPGWVQSSPLPPGTHQVALRLSRARRRLISTSGTTSASRLR